MSKISQEYIDVLKAFIDEWTKQNSSTRPWPQKNDTYWMIGYHGLRSFGYQDTSFDNLYFDQGLVFKTEREAAHCLKRWRLEITILSKIQQPGVHHPHINAFGNATISTKVSNPFGCATSGEAWLIAKSLEFREWVSLCS